MSCSKALFVTLFTIVPMIILSMVICAPSADADPSDTGQCGDDVYWTYYPYQSRLVIEGQGAIYDYSSSDERWGGNLDNLDTSVTVEIGEGVTSIGEYAFSGCKSITSVALPDSLTEIDSHSFLSCNNLPSICIPKGVGTIGIDAFDYCSNLASIEVAEENLVFQSHEGVLYTKGLTELMVCPCNKEGTYNMPDGVKVIRENSFNTCEKLAEVALPDTLETIEGSAFWFCESLDSLEIPKNVKSIGIQMAYECPELQAINVDPDNKYYASDNGVLFDKNMNRILIYPQAKSGTSYDVPEGVQRIDDYAFSDCKNLTEVTLPKSLKTLGAFAFFKCSSLSKVTISYGLSKITQSAFEECESLSEVIIPDSVTEIENWSFVGSNNITSITIPYSVSILGYNAFDVSFYSADGDKLNNTADNLRGHHFEKKDGKLQAVDPGVQTISFEATGGNEVAPLTTSVDGRLSELPNTQ